MKVTGMCIPERENRGHSVYDFVEKGGGIVCGIQKKFTFFWFEFPKIGDHPG